MSSSVAQRWRELPRRDRIDLALISAAALVAAVPLVRGVARYSVHTIMRLLSPWPIQWIEPFIYRNALRAAAGEPLHAAPSLDYAPSQYGAFYASLNGLLLRVFGGGYPALRIFVYLLFIALLVLILVWVQRAVRSWPWTVAVAGLIVSLSQPNMALWFSSVNVDIPYLLPAFAAFFVLRFYGEQRAAVIAAGLLLALSFHMKATGIYFSPAALVFVFIYHRRHTGWFVLACAGTAGLVSLYLLWSSDGWFWKAVVEVTRQAPDKIRKPRFWSRLRASSSSRAVTRF